MDIVTSRRLYYTISEEDKKTPPLPPGRQGETEGVVVSIPSLYDLETPPRLHGRLLPHLPHH